MKQLRVLVVGCGNMGTSHARAYHGIPEFELVGLVSRQPESRERLSKELGNIATFSSFADALASTQPDVVSINTYPQTHAEYARSSFESGAHVFVEKPIALNVKEAQELVELAKQYSKKLVVGYILRVHPAWQKFTELAQGLGKPLVMRMNLNQQSCASQWHTHKQLMETMSPMVDCGVHYVDVMCQMTGANPIRVSAIGAKLTKEVAEDMYNYSQLQVSFDDGSVGWYEAGWGPMMSETAFFIKDVIGPNGSVSIVDAQKDNSQDLDGHTQTGCLRLHHGKLNAQGEFEKEDELIDTSDEPSHDALCELEQRFLLQAILNDEDLTAHMQDAVNSLKIVLAADEAFKTGRTVEL